MAKIVQKIEPKKPLVQERKKVCAYARVSSDKDEMLHSLSSQVSYYSSFIQSHGEWQYVGVYADSAVTGTKDSRAEFQKMLNECRKGNIDIILTKSISRFARNTVTLLSTVRELKTLAVDVWFEKENIHSMSNGGWSQTTSAARPCNPDGELMLTILASFAQEESLSVSENCKWRIRHNYEQGTPNGFTLYGYDIHKRKMSINEYEANIVRQIFQMYAEGMGSAVISRVLNENGIKAPIGKEWYAHTIMNILTNEKYIGDLLLQKFYKDNHITKNKCRNTGELQQYYCSPN